MNLFAQLAQQTLGETPAPITPRLAARFEHTALSQAFTADAIEARGLTPKVREGAGKVRGLTPKVREGAGEVRGLTPKVREGAGEVRGLTPKVREGAGEVRVHTPALQASAESLRPDISTTQQLASHDTELVSRRVRASTLQQPTIEPAPSARTESREPRTGSSASLLDPQLSILQSTSSASQEAAPTIHVSIGRVEVRAVMRPQEPPRRERGTPRTPSQPLDEYLRKGRGGR